MSNGVVLVNQFTGGFSDDPTKASENQYEVCNNFFLTGEGLLITRDGSEIVNATVVRPSVDRTVALLNYDFDAGLLAVSGTHIYQNTGTAWTDILGPTSNPALPEALGRYRVNYSEWRKHIFLTDEAMSHPVKIYKDENGAYQVRTAGLPEVPEDPNYDPDYLLGLAIALANAARTSLLAHYANTSAHPTADTASAAIITSSAASDLATLKTLVGQLLKSYDVHSRKTKNGDLFHYAEVPSDIYLRVREQDYLVDSTETPETVLEAVTALNDLKIKSEQHWYQNDRHQSRSAEVASTLYSADLLLDYADGPLITVSKNSIYNYANTIKAKLNAHYASVDTSATYNFFTHNVAADTTNPITSANASTPQTLRTLLSEMFVSYNRHHDDADDEQFTTKDWHIASTNSDWYTHASHWVYVTSGVDPDLQPDAFDGFGAGNWELAITRLNLLKNKYNGHLFDGISPVAANKPHGTASSGVKQTFSVPGDDLTLASYTYAFCWKHTYQVGSVEYIDRGNFLRVQASNVIEIDFEPQAITNLPVLANGSLLNYDTTNLKLEIYRTTDGGNVFYKVGEVANGTTTFSDYVTDADLTSMEQAYITGGVVENDPPPKCKFFHIVGNIGYYGNIIEGTESLTNRVRASVPDDIDSCPEDFFTDLPYPCQGLSSAKGVPIAWTDRSFYRIEGSFDETGQGAMVYSSISDNIGVRCPYSFVQIDNAVLFWGTDGVYMTDGYQYQKLTSASDSLYQSWTATAVQQKAVVGTYDRRNRRVWWAVQDEDGNDCNICVVLDLTVPVTANSAFQTISNGSSFAPTALGYFEDKVVRGDTRGFVFKHHPDYLTDPLITNNPTGTYTAQVRKAILPTYSGPAFIFNNEHARKWLTKILVKGENIGNASIQVSSINDLGKVHGDCTVIRYRKNIVWGDESIVWGDEDTIWDLRGMIDEKRHFPNGSLRTTYTQIKLTGGYMEITTSADSDSATLVQSTATLTLDDASDWDLDILDFYISFGPDYGEEFRVLSQAGSAITLEDINGTLPVNGSYDWKLSGFPKNERWKLLSYLVPYSYLGETQSDAGGESGSQSS